MYTNSAPIIKMKMANTILANRVVIIAISSNLVPSAFNHSGKFVSLLPPRSNEISSRIPKMGDLTKASFKKVVPVLR